MSLYLSDQGQILPNTHPKSVILQRPENNTPNASGRQNRSSGRGRRRGRAGGHRRGGASTSYLINNPSIGCKTYNKTATEMIYADDFLDTLFSLNTSIFYSEAILRIEAEQKKPGLPFREGGVVLMLTDRVFPPILESIDGSIKLRKDRASLITKFELRQNPAVLLTSDTTGLTMQISVEVLKRFEGVVPPVKQMQWLS